MTIDYMEVRKAYDRDVMLSPKLWDEFRVYVRGLRRKQELWLSPGNRWHTGPKPITSLLAVSDALGTGRFAADAANVKPGKTAVVVGDGAVGLLAALSAKQMGAERIIAMSRHEPRQKLAREFGATDIVTERGDQGVA